MSFSLFDSRPQTRGESSSSGCGQEESMEHDVHLTTGECHIYLLSTVWVGGGCVVDSVVYLYSGDAREKDKGFARPKPPSGKWVLGLTSVCVCVSPILTCLYPSVYIHMNCIYTALQKLLTVTAVSTNDLTANLLLEGSDTMIHSCTLTPCPPYPLYHQATADSQCP